jgi:3-oxoadipate enol-lactonase
MPTAKTNRVETYYEVQGEGPPLVLIHGIGACTKLWQPQMEAFSQHFCVVVYDVRGHGQSTGADERYSIGLFGSDLKALLDALGIAKAHLCGLSMGGLIAQQFGIDYPDRVGRLVLAGTFCHLGFAGRLLTGVAQAVNRIVMAFMNMEQYARLGAKGLFKEEGQEDLREFYVAEVAWVSKEEFLKAVRATYAFDSLKMLKTIQAPTLILNSEGEKVERRQAQLMHEHIPDSRTAVIPGAFHAANLETPEAFNRLVLAFLLE